MIRIFQLSVMAVGLFIFALTPVYAADCDVNWSSFGNPNGPIYAIARSGDILYVGGNFTMIGGIQANSIAKWDGQNWSALMVMYMLVVISSKQVTILQIILPNGMATRGLI